MADKDALTFSAFLQRQEDGQLIQDLNDAVVEIVAQLNNAVMEHGGVHTAGLGLALSFKIENGAIDVKAEMKTKLPKENRPRTIFWSTPDNHLSAKNPRQEQLPFKDVNDRQEVRDAL